MEINILEAYGKIDEVKRLFREYADFLRIDLQFQDFAGELENLPGKYAPPGGALYLAEADGMSAGCGALRKLDWRYCEMKRLYVRPEYRNIGIGFILTEKIINEARRLGYDKIFLDTLANLTAAIKMYEKLGFLQTEPYYDNPIKNAVYFVMDL